MTRNRTTDQYIIFSGNIFTTFKPFNFTLSLPIRPAMRIPLNTRVASDELPIEPGALTVMLAVDWLTYTMETMTFNHTLETFTFCSTN